MGAREVFVRIWPMDDQGNWPTPLPADAGPTPHDLNQQAMEDLRSDPQALKSIGGIKGNIWILLAPLIAVILLIPTWMQWRTTGSILWLAVIAVILIAAALVWISRVQAVLKQARHVLSSRVAGTVGYGVGVIRSIQFPDQPEALINDEEPAQAGVPTTDVELTLSVSPVRGNRFTATSTQRYATVDALQLDVGQHGPVRYLTRDPETTTVIETDLEPEAVQKIYRAAALN